METDISEADSIVVDPHKALSMPYGNGILLVRNRHVLSAVLKSDGDKDDAENQNSSAFESVRPLRALSVWFTLMLLGGDCMIKLLKEKIYLSRYLYRQLERIQGIAMGSFPELTIVTFRYM